MTLLLLVLAGLSLLIMNRRQESHLEKIGELFFKTESQMNPGSAYKDIVQKYPSYPVAQIASLLLAGEEWRQGKENEAISALKASVGKLPSVFSSIALWGEVQLLWQQRKNDEALALLTHSGSRGAEEFLGGYFQYLQGEILASSNKTAEAKALFEKIIQPGNEEADVYLQKMARNRLLNL